ncbi:MAG: permease [Syntrophobacteraceae bacterium]
MDQSLQIFSSVAISVFLEASPFLMLGALISAVFEVYMARDRIEKYLPKSRFLGILFGLSAGMLMPTCECGIVSIVRRLLKKGVPSHIAMTYMIATPVINPLVIASTYIAYRGDMWMILGRICMVAICAVTIGLAFSRVDPALLLREAKGYAGLFEGGYAGTGSVEVSMPAHACFATTHGQGCGCHAGCEIRNESKFIAIVLHTASEFLEMGKYLALGAFAVGLSHVFVPQELFLLLQNNLFFAIGGMMFLAVLLSICSEADAFVAASFSFAPKVAQLSFLSLGPMVDLKLIVMYGAIFQKRVAFTLIIVPVLLIYLLSSLIGAVVR